MNLVGLPGEIKEKILNCLKLYNEGKTVLILGETGVGKTYLAKEFHRSSKWAQGRFIRIDLASLETELFGSELFGYEGGSFTGALRSGKEGLIEGAQNGTIFFDEIGNLDLRYQKKLLIFLEERKFRRLGGNKYLEIRAGLIFATNTDLKRAISRNLFRKDLYYRINNCVIEIPPLRERVEYLESIIERLILSNELSSMRFTGEAMERLRVYRWPGNLRELLSYLKYWSSQGLRTVDIRDLPEEIRDHGGMYEFKRGVEECKRRFLIRVLKVSNWNINEAARRMGVSRQHIYKLIKQLEIDVDKHRNKS